MSLIPEQSIRAMGDEVTTSRLMAQASMLPDNRAAGLTSRSDAPWRR